MGRILSLVVACAIAAVPAYVAGAYAVAPALASTANPVTTSAGTAKTTTNVAQTTTATTTTSVTGSTTGTASVTTKGNGAPSGSHYNLNIIGVPKDKTADMNNNDGHRIFVQLINTTGSTAGEIIGKNFTDISKVNTILLAPPLPGSGGSFQVLDANATDKNGAIFQLPSDISSWTVWARALGTPGGTADMTTCATVTVVDPLNPLGTIQEVVCSLTLTLTRSKNAKFQDVTQELLTINTGTTLVGTCTSTTVGLFAPCLQNYFWNYDNHGLKLLQLRFYPVSIGGGG
ncbi:MAG: hypothetical protein E6J15_09440 [Chloroflexi bacterium]|nr:MAG: hypothetical protein E6J15_09440 [Chloroflexota bacterium]